METTGLATWDLWKENSLMYDKIWKKLLLLQRHRSLDHLGGKKRPHT